MVLEPAGRFPFWILALNSDDTYRLAIVEKEDGGSYRYYNSLRMRAGWLGKHFLSAQIQLGRVKVITNPLEAYAWECYISQIQEIKNE